jgi:curved DNA-binding protein CbpA
MKDYYYILGIKENAELSEIKTAYRSLSKKFHPDTNFNDKYFEDRFKEIQLAYETLSNGDKRNSYDIKLKHYKESRFDSDYLKRREEEIKKQYEEKIRSKEEELKWKYSQGNQEKSGASKYEHTKPNKKTSKSKFLLWIPIILFFALMVLIVRNRKGWNGINDSRALVNSSLIESTIDCDSSVQFGDIGICLPEIDGMVECYSNPLVNKWANQLNHEGNSIHALYFNDKTYKQIENLGEFSFDDYFQIYSVNSSKGVKVDVSYLAEIVKMMEMNFTKKEWSEIKNNIESRFDRISLGKPIVLENYSIDSMIETFVLLLKYHNDDSENIMIGLFNFIIVKDRLIWLTYYKDYLGKDSIEEAKAKNDYITYSFMDVN